MIDKKRPFFQFNQFLDSRAEIHQLFALIFWKIYDIKVILKLTDLLKVGNLEEIE